MRTGRILWLLLVTLAVAPLAQAACSVSFTSAPSTGAPGDTLTFTFTSTGPGTPTDQWITIAKDGTELKTCTGTSCSYTFSSNGVYTATAEAEWGGLCYDFDRGFVRIGAAPLPVFDVFYTTTTPVVNDDFGVQISEEYTQVGGDTIDGVSCTGLRTTYEPYIRVIPSWGGDTGWMDVGTSPGNITYSGILTAPATAGSESVEVRTGYSRRVQRATLDYTGCTKKTGCGVCTAPTIFYSPPDDNILNTDTTPFTIQPEACTSSNVETLCPDSSWDNPADGYYCSYGEFGTNSQGYCCPEGESWNATLGTCVGTTQCYPESPTQHCGATVSQASYFSDVGCFDAFQVTYASGDSCCNFGDIYGTGTDVYKYQNTIELGVSGPTMTGMEFCGGTVVNCDDGTDNICPNTYSDSGLVCVNGDGNCAEVCGNGIDDDRDGFPDSLDSDCNVAACEECTTGGCCDSNGCFRSSGYVCAGTSSWTCGGPGSPDSCTRSRNAAVCSGSSGACPAVTTQVQNAPAGQVCEGGVFTTLDADSYCGLTGRLDCNAQQPIGYRLACNGAGACSGPSSVTGSEPQYTIGSACTGAENNLCIGGTCTDMCWVPAGDGFDNNANSRRDNAEVGICGPLCDAAAEGEDTFSCSPNPPSAPAGGIDSWQNYSASDGYTCTLNTEYCYMASCRARSVWNAAANACEEDPATGCSDGADNDDDGLFDLEDPDCGALDNPPLINEFSFSPIPATQGLQGTFRVDVTDYQSMTYTITPGDGSGPISFSAGYPLLVDEPFTYTSIVGEPFIASLSVTDAYGKTSTTTTTVPVNCAADGAPAGSAAECCAESCFTGSSCVGSAGTAACLPGTDRICPGTGDDFNGDGYADAVDRDADPSYTTGVGCSPATWVDSPAFTGYWCERGTCDTADLDDSDGFMCGDDPNENVDFYDRYSDFYDATPDSYAGCLASATTCYGRNAAGVDQSYSGTEVCTDQQDDQDCDGYLPYYDQDSCFATIYGDVVLIRDDGVTQGTWDVNISSERYPDDDLNGILPISTLSDDTGAYSWSMQLPYGLRNITATFLGVHTNTTEIDLAPASTTELDFAIQERNCLDGCQNQFGQCDRTCLGEPGCSALDENETRVLNASHPLYSSVGKEPGTLVYLQQNETHRETGIACSTYLGWEEAPRANLRGDMSNLIKYTRLITYQGKPARMVIATWN